LAIYNALRRHKAKIKTFCDGFAASIASVIFMAGDERIMSNASLLFIHNAWTYASGNANDLRKQAEDLDTITQASVNAYMNHVSITEEELKVLLDGESWIAPQDALLMGFATSIINDDTNKNPNQSIKKQLMQQLSKSVEAPKEPIVPQSQEPTPKPEPTPEQNTLKNFLAGIKTC
jgi:ATP-dependent Clp protease protease subunit